MRGASKECGAITLDLLLRAGVIVEVDDGSWELAKNWESRRIYLYGDAKTIENMTKFVRDMQDCRISYTHANIQLEVFLKALAVVMDAPGDWHTGLNMLQSIYNIYYYGFLDQFQDLLRWQRVTKDVRSCYFQAARLVTFVSDELIRFFLHQFIAEREVTVVDKQCNDSSTVTIEFMEFLEKLKGSDDKWIATCAKFLKISCNFLEFVNAYRLGDAVCVEYGYQKYASVWEALGQSKYVKIFYSQQETLYRDFPFSRLQEMRLNRFVCRHHGSTGKRCVAQDEFLEHGNRFYSAFPIPKMLQSF